MPTPSTVTVSSSVPLGNHLPLGLLGGVNVLETRDLTLRVAESLAHTCRQLDMPFVFKASFDKANRSAIHSYRGPGIDQGLRWLQEVKSELGLPILTDIHEPAQAAIVAEVADVIQIPAFLVRQTDLLAAACATGRPLHLKKMQMMAPEEMRNVVAKCTALGQPEVIVCERGTLFGYGRLVVDPLSLSTLRALNRPVSFDVTHALQLPGGLGHATDGRGHLTEPLARAGVSQGIAALFLEVHPDPSSARCDGPCALPLEHAAELLGRLQRLDALIRSWEPA